MTSFAGHWVSGEVALVAVTDGAVVLDTLLVIVQLPSTLAMGALCLLVAEVTVRIDGRAGNAL